MADGYYFKPKRAQNRKKGRFWLGLVHVLDWLMWVATGLVTVLLIMAMSARYVSPAGVGYWFAFAGLIFPILFIGEIAVALYWTIRWRWVAIVVGAFVLFCLPDARLFYKPDLAKHYDSEQPAPREGIVIMSYNVMGFGYAGTSTRKMEATAGKIADYIASKDIDILCTQEFMIKEGLTDEYFEARLPDLKYSYSVTYSNPAGAEGIGVAIYSRYPILARGEVNTGEMRRSIWCDIRINRDTIRVFSNHLQNTNITATDQDYMAQSFFVDSNTTVGRVRSVAKRLRDAYRLRAPQADSVARAIAVSPNNVIVCGDFNDTPLSYAYHRIARGLNDSYVAKGAGAMGTYHGFFNMFRIDYILYCKQLRAVRFEVSDIVLSDHNPIIAELAVDKPETIYGR